VPGVAKCITYGPRSPGAIPEAARGEAIHAAGRIANRIDHRSRFELLGETAVEDPFSECEWNMAEAAQPGNDPARRRKFKHGRPD